MSSTVTDTDVARYALVLGYGTISHRYWVASRLCELLGEMRVRLVTIQQMIAIEEMKDWAPASTWFPAGAETNSATFDERLADFLGTVHQFLSPMTEMDLESADQAMDELFAVIDDLHGEVVTMVMDAKASHEGEAA